MNPKHWYSETNDKRYLKDSVMFFCIQETIGPDYFVGPKSTSIAAGLVTGWDS